jgi:ketosteroid isomerase-like protein
VAVTYAADARALGDAARVRSRLEIGELPARYAMAIDARDLDTLVGLFVDDVAGGHRGNGRPALRDWYDEVLRRFGRSIHLICGHTVDFIDDDHASGHVYCRAEHEDGDGWYVMAMRYDDVYERRDGAWFFVRRKEHPWYAVDVLDRPSAPYVRWPGHEGMRATLPERFPTWEGFWGHPISDEEQR